ncbi:C6 zinc finger domain-containing protein [Macrophomina phaseolina MS6]|uniref:C6 zinc finger domain-containing protein n=1 Tax=Macrophomina phaseolina (strain MS6) TaxID=1126212 RepID=K2SCD9_MACPH|nr:C6 zinc finger domain-containing protein [Macrophomina phaseolina MS6]
MQDMSLIWYYTTSTSSTFAERPQTIKLYRTSAPAVAFSEPVLLFALLAVAALHRAHTELEPENREKYFNVATSHQHRSIGILQELLPDITPANCSAVFLASSLVPIFTLASECWLRQPFSDAAPMESLSDVISCIHLLRGVPSILSHGNHAVFGWIMDGPLRPLTEGFLLKPKGHLTPEQDAQFAALYGALMEDEGVSEVELHVYSEALDTLKEYAGLILDVSVQQRIDVVGLTLTWPTIVSGRYLEYLQARRNGALLIFARYAVLFDRIRGFWWAGGWGQILRSVSLALLPEKWWSLLPELSQNPL